MSRTHGDRTGWFWGGCLALLVGLAGSGWPVEARAASGDWSHDAAAALKQAEAEGKDILINVTGSDWCPGCIQLDRQVFSTRLFQLRVPEAFVLLEFDFPRGKVQSEAVKAQNRDWRVRLEAYEGYPTVLLADAQGRPYARAELNMDPVAFTFQLYALRSQKAARDAAFAEAAELDGLGRARRLDAALRGMGGQVWVTAYADVVDQIIVLDADDEAGLRSVYEARRDEARAEAYLTRVDGLLAGQRFAEALRLLDEALARRLTPVRRQGLTGMKAVLLFDLGEREAGYALLGEAIELGGDADQTRQFQTVLEQMRAAMGGPGVAGG